jgi:multiple sugar transport system substrate-binding protein
VHGYFKGEIMNVSRKVGLAVVAGVALTALLAGCSSPSSSSTGTGKGGGTTINGIAWPTYTGNAKLTVWTWAGAPQTTKVVPAFEKEYPNIKVDIENVGAGAAEYSKLTTANSAGSGGPDVVMLEYPYLPEFVSSKALADISSYTKPFMSKLPKWAVSSVTFDGGVYNFPYGGGTQALIYRADVLSKAKLSVPTTWTQFAAEAVALHKADPSEYMTYFPNNDPEYVLALLQQAGVNPFTESKSGKWTIDLNNAKSRAVMNYWGDLIKEGAINVQGDFTPAWQNSIATGEYASYLGADWFPSAVLVPYIKGKQPFTVTTMPQSGAGTPVAGNWGGSGYSVTSQSKNKQAGALFAAFMDLGGANDSLAAGSLPVVNNANQFPAYTSSPGTQQGFTQNLNKVYQGYQGDVNANFTFSPWTTVLNNSLNSEEAKAVAGSESWGDILKNVQSQVVSYAKSQGYQVAVAH